MPPMTKDVWEIREQDFPVTLPIELQLRFLLRYAILAPSARNSQPWRFEIDNNTAVLFAAQRVPQPHSDPEDRELYLSLGCALENLLIAAEHFGFAHEVTYFPDGAKSDLAARVVFEPGGSRSLTRADITLNTILQRHNDNGVYRSTPVPEDVRQRLQACCVESDLRLDLTDGRFFYRCVDALTLEADRLEFANAGFRKELASWISQGVFGNPPVISRLGGLAVAQLDLGEAVAKQDHQLVESAALLGLISARSDTHMVHVKAGQLFERLWLRATAMGVRVHPMSQTMRHPELRAAVGELVPEPGWKPLHLFRVGYARSEKQRQRHTPRRPLEGDAHVKNGAAAHRD
jgi:nitroreductase